MYIKRLLSSAIPYSDFNQVFRDILILLQGLLHSKQNRTTKWSPSCTSFLAAWHRYYRLPNICYTVWEPTVVHILGWMRQGETRFTASQNLFEEQMLLKTTSFVSLFCAARDTWDSFHAVSSALATLAFSTLLIAILHNVPSHLGKREKQKERM